MTEAQRLPFDHDQAAPASDFPGPRSRLDPDEDAELRRLHMLRGFGMVAGTVSSRYEALRGRDRRSQVREPDDAKLAIQIEKSVWGGESGSLLPQPAESSPAQQPDPAPDASSPQERVISDTREIFGELPETRRGLGIFRR